MQAGSPRLHVAAGQRRLPTEQIRHESTADRSAIPQGHRDRPVRRLPGSVLSGLLTTMAIPSVSRRPPTTAQRGPKAQPISDAVKDGYTSAASLGWPRSGPLFSGLRPVVSPIRVPIVGLGLLLVEDVHLRPRE